jgi:hypothetical protein
MNGGTHMLNNKGLRRCFAGFLVLFLSFASIFPVDGNVQVHAQEALPAAAAVSDIGTPPILITEIVPDSADVTGSTGTEDAYEYVEIYNNSDRPMDMKDYKIIYRYPNGNESDAVWNHEPESVVIQPGKTLIFWLKNANNANVTMEQFNAHYGTNLVLNQDVVRVSAGMHSGRSRWIVVASNTGHEIVSAAYNIGVDDAQSDMGVVYQYPLDGSNEMIKTSSRTVRGTPGSIDPGQVPKALNPLPEDNVPPALSNQSVMEAEPTAPIDLVVTAEDSSLVKTVSLFYRTDRQTAYTKVNLKAGRANSLFRYTINGQQILGSKYVEYYFTASDGYNESTSEVFRCNIVVSTVSPRLNVADGQAINGFKWIKAAASEAAPDSLKLSIDGVDALPVKAGLEHSAYFAFDANGADRNYKNVVKQDGAVIHQFDYGVSGFKTVMVPVDGITEGPNKISIVSGSFSAPYDGISKENLDDYDVRNVRLLLPDGTVLKDPMYSNPSTVLDMGDNGRFLPVVDFTFTLAKEQAGSLLYNWDTAPFSDGPHRVAVVTPDGKKAEATISVDNNGPVITTSLNEGKSYKGSFGINATITDAVSGVSTSDITLDGKRIELPYAASSAQLIPGPHTLTVSAADNMGNKSEYSVHFSSVEEHPARPEVVSPVNGAGDAGLSPTLQVKVTDPTEDPLQVSFFRGYQYQADHKDRVSVFTGASDTEPPQGLRSEGERRLTDEELADVASTDSHYLTNDSTTQFPYLRYEVKLEDNFSAEDRVELVWKGRSLPGRKVTLYAWNYQDSTWRSLHSLTAKSEDDFELRGSVSAQDFVRERTAHFIVQDQLEGSLEDKYAFVWLPDTQFYSQTFSHIYESQVNWIRDHAEEYNVKYVFHTGDLVENYHQDYQWAVADRSMKILEDAGIPYGVIAGNHDVSATNDYTMFSKYFGAARFRDMESYAESYKDNRGHYDLISVAGVDYIMAYMGWGEGPEEIQWLNKILAEHPDRKAILGFHDYVLANGQISATGQKLFNEVVKRNPNVFMVLSGHYTGAALNTVKVDDNGDGTPERTVYQILSDYQELGEGGDGYMKLLLFNPADGTIQVKTYSPYKDDYNYYDPVQYPNKDEFSLHIDLTPQVKRVATDYIEANVYSNEPIDSVKHISSGQTAEALWRDLEPNQKYFWYASVQDAFGGRSVSDLWNFTTKNVLPSPQNLRVTGITDTEIGLAWSPITIGGNRSVTYDVYMNGSRSASVTGSVYNLANLSPDKEYSFFIIANDQTGAYSEPGEILTVRTKVNLSVIRFWVEHFIASDELRGPLANQLANQLEQAEHQSSKGDPDKARKHIEDFLMHINNDALQSHISTNAKGTLLNKVISFLKN